MFTLRPTMIGLANTYLQSSFHASEDRALQTAINENNAPGICAALQQVKAADADIRARITSALMTNNKGLGLEAKRALYDYLLQNGFDSKEPLQGGMTLTEIANENGDHALVDITSNHGSTPAAPDPLKDIGKAFARAAGVALVVATPTAILDRAVAEKASGVSNNLWQGVQNGMVELYKHPLQFFKGKFYGPMAGVYLATYGAANGTETICNNLGLNPTYYKLVASSVVNIVASNLRDALYAQMAGKGPARPTPILSRVLYATRDCLTIGAGFTLPKYVAQQLESKYNLSKESATYISQLGTPLAMQPFISPIHLFALDFYNNPISTLSERSSRVWQEYKGTTIARMGRTAAVYSIGGVLNTKLKELFDSSEPRKL